MERNRGGRPRHPDVLTPAEWRVLDALREGGTNAELAARLGLSPDTVKTHISNMLAKLELRDRRALAAWRPDAPRRRLGGVLAVPAALWSVGRPLAWVGVGAAALAGVAVVVVALVALEVIVEGDSDPRETVEAPAPIPTVAPTVTPLAAVAPPPASPTPTTTPAPTATPAAPTATPVATATAEPSPAATPDATPAPRPTATPLPAATAPAAASPCEGIDCIELVTGAFEHKTWEQGEETDWTEGFFFLDTVTGRTDGYRTEDLGWSPGMSLDRPGSGPWLKLPRLLIDRRSGESWRWPDDTLTLMAASEEHLFVAELPEAGLEARFAILDSDMSPVGEFLHMMEQDYGTRASFSPDGKTIVFVLDSAVAYLIDVESVSQRPLLERAVREGWSEGAIFIENAYRGPGILVRTFYSRGADDSDDVRAWESSSENRYFTWSGEPLPGREEPFWTTCDGHLSPNGRYTARSVGDYISTVHGRDFIPREPPWPSIVIADAETCAPLFRVQSALPAHNSGLQGYYSAEWAGSWLPDSSGYVVQVANGYATVRTSGNPELHGLPSGRGAPFTAPAGDGRYFLYGWDGAWDSLEDSWTAPPAGGVSRQGFSWGGDETEVRYVAVDGYWGDFGFNWLLLPPKIEFPPFSDEIAFRVRGSGDGCIDLTGDQQTDTAVAGCIPGGARLTLAVPDNPPQQDCGFTCYPSVRGGPGHWSVYVRTEDGLEGWIPLDSLEHD